MSDQLFLLLFFGLLFMFLFFAAFITIESTDNWTHYETIVSLKDSSNISGSFFLGTGSIDQKQYYVAYVTTTNQGNTFKQIKIPVNKTIIEENNNQTPRIVSKWKISGYISKTKTHTHFKIIVPKNTIIKQFKIQ